MKSIAFAQPKPHCQFLREVQKQYLTSRRSNYKGWLLEIASSFGDDEQVKKPHIDKITARVLVMEEGNLVSRENTRTC